MSALTQLTTPTDCVSLSDAKTWLRIPSTMTADDFLISNLIISAREYVSRYTGKQITGPCQYSQTMDMFPLFPMGYFSLVPWFTLPGNVVAGSPSIQNIDWGVYTPADYSKQTLPNYGVIKLPRPPLLSVQSVNYIDPTGVWQVMPSNQYEVITSQNMPGYLRSLQSGWPSIQQGVSNAVSITFTSGFATTSAVPQTFRTAILLLVTHWYENRAAIGGASKAIAESIDRLLASDSEYLVVM